MMEYALVAENEHRSDGVQENRMEVYLDYALATENSVSEHSSDPEHIQGGDGIATSDQVERSHKQ